MKLNKRKIITVAVMGFVLILSGTTFQLLVHLKNLAEEKQMLDEVKKNAEVEQIIREQETKVKNGELFKVEEVMENFPQKLLSRNQLRRCYALLGDINAIKYGKETEPTQRAMFFHRAVNFFNRALEIVDTDSEVERMRHRIGQLYLLAEEWETALGYFTEPDSFSLMPEERVQLGLARGKCFRNLGNYREALKNITVAIDSDYDSIRYDALCIMAEIYEIAAVKADALKQLLGSENNLPLTEKELAKEQTLYREKALAGFKDVIAGTMTYHDSNARARLGQLRLHIDDNEQAQAYEMASRLANSGCKDKYKVNAFFELARMEELRGDLPQAIAVLTSAVRRFQRVAAREGAYVQLYHYYKQRDDWVGAFKIAQQLLNGKDNIDGLVELINDFASRDNPLFAILAENDDISKYAHILEKLTALFKERYPGEWEGVKYQLYYIMARISLLNNSQQEFDEHICKVYQELPEDRKVLEKFMHLDFAAALQFQLPPPVVIARCCRYLAVLKQGGHYKEVMQTLLDNYYLIGLSDSALKVAKKIYFDELDSLVKKGEAANSTSGNVWLRTVVIIGECYEKIGDFRSNNHLLQPFALTMLKMPFASRVYRSWGWAAGELEQYFEARRRYSIAWQKAQTEQEKLKIDIARTLLDIRFDGKKSWLYSDLKNLLKRVAVSSFTPAQRKEEDRILLEAGLALAAERGNQQEFTYFLNMALKRYSKDLWSGYWGLSNLSGELDVDALMAVKNNGLLFLANVPDAGSVEKETRKAVTAQLDIVSKLIKLEENLAKVKQERGI